MNSLVSVVIPAYNAENTIVGCVQSVLDQTYTNTEIIVVDDGSKDGTVSLLKCMAQSLPEGKLQVISQKNAGPSVARNNGIGHAKGEYIAFLDADDSWLPIKLEKQMPCFESEGVGLVGCRFCIGDVRVDEEQSDTIHVDFKKLLFKNYFVTSSVVVAAGVCRNFHFNSSQKYSEDYRLWLQIASEYRCILLTETLGRSFDKPVFGASGLSSNLWGMEKGELLNYKMLLTERKISPFLYIACCGYSLIKYARRYMISISRNIFQ